MAINEDCQANRQYNPPLAGKSDTKLRSRQKKVNKIAARGLIFWSRPGAGWPLTLGFSMHIEKYIMIAGAGAGRRGGAGEGRGVPGKADAARAGAGVLGWGWKVGTSRVKKAEFF